LSTEDFTAYVQGSWARMFRTAYALTGDVGEAEDLLQRTLVKTFVHWKKVARAEAPDSYVRRMMVNDATSSWRVSLRRREVLTSDVPERAGDADFDALLATSDELWRHVQQLPPRQRAVLVLRFYEDLSEREIAGLLGIAPGTVKSLSSAAITKLRDHLGPVHNQKEQA